MAVRTGVSLNSFFIFNSTFGPKEGEEHKKILYFYPDGTDIDKKIKQVGLCEAVIQFTRNFTEKPCESVRTQLTHQVFFEPEDNFWVVMTVNVPCITKSKDGRTVKEYCDDEVQDPIYKAILVQTYELFRLLNNSFLQILSKHDLRTLITCLERFFNKYLTTLRLEHGDIMDIFNGILFLPLHKTTYLLIQSFINLLEDSFPQIHYTAFLYNDQLVWSGLEQEDMRVLYRYLTTSLLPNCVASELQGNDNLHSRSQFHYGKYVVVPPVTGDAKSPGLNPSMKVYLSSDQEREHHLIVYRALSATICLLVNGNLDISAEIYKRLDHFLGQQMTSLASAIADHYVKTVPSSSSSEFQCKYVYFNCMNLAVKTTVHVDGKRHGSATVPMSVMRIITDLHQNIPAGESGGECETFVRAESDYWIVAKKSDRREFYVIMNHKNANLPEISDEVKKLCSSQFNNIFLLD